MESFQNIFLIFVSGFLHRDPQIVNDIYVLTFALNSVSLTYEFHKSKSKISTPPHDGIFKLLNFSCMISFLIVPTKTVFSTNGGNNLFLNISTPIQFV